MLGGTKKVTLLYCNGSFSPPSKDKDSVSKGSMKRAARRHKPTKSASEFRTSRSCPFCQQADLAPITVDRKIQTNNTALDLGTCGACKWGNEAGCEQSMMQKDKGPAMDIRRGGIAEMQNKRRPYDQRNAYHSL